MMLRHRWPPYLEWRGGESLTLDAYRRHCSLVEHPNAGRSKNSTTLRLVPTAIESH